MVLFVFFTKPFTNARLAGCSGHDYTSGALPKGAGCIPERNGEPRQELRMIYRHPAGVGKDGRKSARRKELAASRGSVDKLLDIRDAEQQRRPQREPEAALKSSSLAEGYFAIR